MVAISLGAGTQAQPSGSSQLRKVVCITCHGESHVLLSCLEMAHNFSSRPPYPDYAYLTSLQEPCILLCRRAVFLAGIFSSDKVHARIKNVIPSIAIEDPELMPVLETSETMTLADQV